jgi:hypothetical protein
MQLTRTLAGALGLLLATGAGAAKPFNWDVPGAIQRLDVPGLVVSHGVPTRIQAVKSSWKLEDLLQHFATAFEKAGLYLPPPKHQLQLLRELQLTALDPGRLISYTVIFQESRDGTVVILGEANLGQRQRNPAHDWAPLFPGATGVLGSQQEGARTLVYSARARPDEVAGFYREALGKAGFLEQEPGSFVKAGEELRVSTHGEKEGRLTVLLMDRLREEARLGPPSPGAR